MQHPAKILTGTLFGAIVGMAAATAFLALAWLVRVGGFVELIYHALRWIFGPYPTVGFYLTAAGIGAAVGGLRAERA